MHKGSIRVVTAFRPIAHGESGMPKRLKKNEQDVLQVPKFATETEEAKWWYDNRDLHTAAGIRYRTGQTDRRQARHSLSDGSQTGDPRRAQKDWITGWVAMAP
jgi:hypothetical protein